MTTIILTVGIVGNAKAKVRDASGAAPVVRLFDDRRI
jgi:hypothetical protein